MMILSTLKMPMACLSAHYAAKFLQLHGKWTETVTCAKYAPKIALMRAAF